MADEVLKVETLNIYQKMARAAAEIGKVGKSLTVETGKNKSYKAVSIEGIVDAVIPVVEKYGIYVFPVSKELIENRVITTTDQYGEKTKFFIRMKSLYRFVNIDNPEEFIEVLGYGDGIDSGDKACGKAETYARKYALITAFNISIGDDPDREASQETAQEVKEISEKTASPNQIKVLLNAYKGENLDKLLKVNGISKIEDLPMAKASEYISKIMSKN